MAQVLNRASTLLLSLLVVSACAQGIESSPLDDSTPAGAAGATADGGAQAQAGANTVAGSSSSGAANGGATGTAGATSMAGATSGGSGGTGSASVGGTSSGGSSAGASTTAGSSMGGSATAGASAGGQGGTSAGAGGKAGSGGASAGGAGGGGGGGGAAACSGKKPEANCVCHTNNAHDYWFCPTARTFAAGESNCVSAGLHMVKIASAAEDKWVNDTANAASFGEYYLGSTDASTPNTWTWLAGGTFWTGLANGTASGYAHWNSGEPNASGDCVVMQSNYVWDDRICTDNRTYICD